MATKESRIVEGTGCKQSRALTRVPLAGGVLVYEPREIGRELVGVEDVTDRAALADGLEERGHERSIVDRLPTLDA